MAGLTPVFLMVFIGLWWDTHCTGYFGSEQYCESRFTEVSQKVAVWIDNYRDMHGRLPDSLQIDWLTKGRWDENLYYDTEEYNRVEFWYRHRIDDDAYKLVSSCGWHQFWSTPDSSWYLFRRWDAEGDSVITVRLSANASVQ